MKVADEGKFHHVEKTENGATKRSERDSDDKSCRNSGILHTLPESANGEKQNRKVFDREGKSAHAPINATSFIVTKGTQFPLFTTKNMGATGAIKISGDSDKLRPKSHNADKDVFGTGARLRILGAYRAPENIVG